MKRSADYKQKLGKNVGFVADSEVHSTPTATVDFDYLQTQLNSWKIDESEFEEADTPEKKRKLLLAKCVPSKAIDEFLAELQSGNASSICKSPPGLWMSLSACLSLPRARGGRRRLSKVFRAFQPSWLADDFRRGVRQQTSSLARLDGEKMD